VASSERKEEVFATKMGSQGVEDVEKLTKEREFKH